VPPEVEDVAQTAAALVRLCHQRLDIDKLKASLLVQRERGTPLHLQDKCSRSAAI